MRIRWRDMELPNRLIVDHEDDFYGKYLIEPFERGFGTTIGNSLRRVLLSTIEGTAITSIVVKAKSKDKNEIEPVLHEYSAVDGILEDFTDIVLNIKGIKVKCDAEQPVTMNLLVEGKGVVTAGQIDTPAEIEILNPDLELATIVHEDSALEIEFTVERGHGYVTADENAEPERKHGVIYVDSLFSPVERVRYKTENTRVGKMTNYDKLIMEIWTNGTVSPKLALIEATKILRKHLNPFVALFSQGREIPFETKPKDKAESEDEQNLDEILKKSIDELKLPSRARNCLQSVQIITIGGLVSKTEDDLMKIHNLGKTSLGDIKIKLEALGLSLGMDIQNDEGMEQILKQYQENLENNILDDEEEPEEEEAE